MPAVPGDTHAKFHTGNKNNYVGTPTCGSLGRAGGGRRGLQRAVRGGRGASSGGVGTGRTALKGRRSGVMTEEEQLTEEMELRQTMAQVSERLAEIEAAKVCSESSAAHLQHS